MHSFEVIPFSFEGREYEIRVVSDGATIHVRAFHKGKPANGYSYQVDLMTAFDLKKLMVCDAIKELVDSAKNDVTERRWERLIEAMKATETK